MQRLSKGKEKKRKEVEEELHSARQKKRRLEKTAQELLIEADELFLAS